MVLLLASHSDTHLQFSLGTDFPAEFDVGSGTVKHVNGQVQKILRAGSPSFTTALPRRTEEGFLDLVAVWLVTLLSSYSSLQAAPPGRS